jgi:hypothetical protein
MNLNRYGIGGDLPPPLAGEGWGEGCRTHRICSAPSLSLPRKRGRGRWGASRHYKRQGAVREFG